MISIRVYRFSKTQPRPVAKNATPRPSVKILWSWSDFYIRKNNIVFCFKITLFLIGLERWIP